MRPTLLASLLLLCWFASLGCASLTQQVAGDGAEEAKPAHKTRAAPGPERMETPPSAIALNPSLGQEIGATYEAFLSPHQEPGEEVDTPVYIPSQFQSTAPSTPRDERTSRGHGTIRFTKDLSKVYVDVKFDNVNPEDVVMFHIHCGKPDVLGPIMLDLAFAGDLQTNLSDGVFAGVFTNEDILATLESGHGPIAAFTLGCSIGSLLPGDVQTIAGMDHIARRGELYFNLHTKGQTFFGDVRGQIYPAP